MTNSDQKEIKKKSKIPYIFFAFFAVFIAVDIFFIFLANKNFHGVVASDSYQRGVDYNQIIAKSKKQDDLGWKMQIFFENSSPKTDSETTEKNKFLGTIEIYLTDKENKKITNAEISIYFKNSKNEQSDFSQKIISKNGFYQEKISFPEVGKWNFIVKAKRGDEEFVSSKEYFIK
jgi:nitrogen fixation protein FixH